MSFGIQAMSMAELKFERDRALAVLINHQERLTDPCGCPACEWAEDRYEVYDDEIKKRQHNG